MFERHEMLRPKVNESKDVNLGINSEPKMVKIGSDLSVAQKEEMIKFHSKF